VRIYEQIIDYQRSQGRAGPDDYLFLPHLRDRSYALAVLGFHLNWVLAETGLNSVRMGSPRSLYSFRHSAITFGYYTVRASTLLTLARNARTSVDVINTYYASTVTGVAKHCAAAKPPQPQNGQWLTLKRKCNSHCSGF
jgi:hypothetical protein